MAKAPGKAVDFDGAGNVWFKVFEIPAIADPAGKNPPTFPAICEWSESFHTLIVRLRSDEKRLFHHSKESPDRRVSIAHRINHSEPNQSRYLVRIEHIALHATDAAQFYIACAQIAVKNGGNGNPGPLVSIPGVYNGNVRTSFLLPLTVNCEFGYESAKTAERFRRNIVSLFIDLHSSDRGACLKTMQLML